MALTISETGSAGSIENLKTSWKQLLYTMQPQINRLPKEEDRDYFFGIPSLLIGKEPRLANIEKKRMYLVERQARLILILLEYHQIWGINSIRRLSAEYLNSLSLSGSEDGLILKYGIGGYSKQLVEQKMINENIEPKKKGWF